MEQVSEATVRMSVPQNVALNGIPSVRVDEKSRTAWVKPGDVEGLQKAGLRVVPEPISDAEFEAMKDRRIFLETRREDLRADLEKAREALSSLTDRHGYLLSDLVEGAATAETAAALASEREGLRFSTEKVAEAIGAVEGELNTLTSQISQEQSLRDKPAQDIAAKALHEKADALEARFGEMAATIGTVLEQRADVEAQRALKYPLSDQIQPLSISRLAEQVRRGWKGPALDARLQPKDIARWIATLMTGPDGSQYAAELSERRCYTHFHYAECGECRR